MNSLKVWKKPESETHLQPPKTRPEFNSFKSSTQDHKSNSLANLVASGKVNLRHRRSQVTLESLKLLVPIVDSDGLLEKRLGGFFAKGGQASVWKSKMRGTEVAVKSFPKTKQSYMAFREMVLLNRIRHPNIITIMAVSEGVTELYIVMEFFDSYTLKQVMFYPDVKKVYNLSMHHKHHILKQLCLALNHLHLDREPIIHRDVKPENALVEWTGEVKLLYNIKLCDLGMSRCKELISELRTSENSCTPKGTEFYLAPELLKKEIPSTKSDVWSAACTILEVYSEAETWNFKKSDIQKNRVAKALLKGQSHKVENVPDFIKKVLCRCFNHEPSQRPSIADILPVIEKKLDEELSIINAI